MPIPQPLEAFYHFPTCFYTSIDTSYIKDLLPEFNQQIDHSKKQPKQDSLNPLYHTGDFSNSPNFGKFGQYVLDTSWGILDQQGYDMSGKATVFATVWGQYYEKTANMPQHAHGDCTRLVGFYFLECPENSSHFMIHDTNAGKNHVGLPVKSLAEITPASMELAIYPKPGMFFFTNAWTPHSLTRHGNKKPLKFIHFNIAVMPAENPTIATLNTGAHPLVNSGPEII
jgi:hypothetical protein